MYSSFEYYTPTKIIFGKDAELEAGSQLKKAGAKKVLIHYGGKSALKSGLIGRVRESLEGAGIAYTELGGVVPNPHLGKVYEGIELGKKEGVDFILAVGGGSVIDSSKAIAAGLANPDDDVWDYYIHRKTTDRALPVATVLTIAAAGSEMSNGSVITNEKNGLKRDFGGEFLRPVFSLMNPALTLTLPAYQTSSGAADILMHTMERFFNQSDNMEITDSISTALMKTVMKYTKVLVDNPSDYRYVCDAAPHRFVKFALDVMGVEEGGTDEETIERGICAMEDFYRQIHMPTNMKELGISPSKEQIRFMAASCEEKTQGPNGAVKPLHKEDMEKIYTMALGE